MRLFCIILMGYILGCSNMAWYLAKAANANLRGSGTGNLGASNAVVLLGWKAGVLTAVHDVLKAVLAVLAAKWLLPDLEYAEAAAGVACVLGHIFPFWLKFRGGKGFAPYIGMMLALDWRFALAVLAAVVLVTVLTDYIVMGTFTTIAALPVYMGIAHRSLVLPAILLVASAVILYKHRENITRLRRGTEIGLRSTIRGDHRKK